MDLLTTYTHHSELQVFTTPLMISTIHITTAPPKPFSSLLCLQQLFPSNGFWQWGLFSFPRSRRYRPENIPQMNSFPTVNSTKASSPLSLPCRAQLNYQPSTNWVPDWGPFHTNLLVFSSQTDFQLTIELLRVRVRVTLRLTVYRQSVRLGDKPLDTHDH
jgi:hypothetical protein